MFFQHIWILFIYFFKFYFIFKLYNVVLVLPNIEMNPPQVKMTIYQMFVYLNIHVLKPVPQCDGIQKWNSWDRIGSRGQPSTKRLTLFIKDTLKNSFTVSFMWGHSKMAISGPGIWSSPFTNLPVPWFWTFWSLELWELIVIV